MFLLQKRMDGPVPMGSAELRAADRWITDMLTSVFTSREIPVNTVLGPCDLKHSSLYDSIAFIALKCSDRRTKPYMLKVNFPFINIYIYSHDVAYGLVYFGQKGLFPCNLCLQEIFVALL